MEGEFMKALGNRAFGRRRCLAGVLSIALFAVIGCGGDSGPAGVAQPEINAEKAIPNVPRPKSLNEEATSDTISLVRPLGGVFHAKVTGARGHWLIQNQRCSKCGINPTDCSGVATVLELPDGWSDEIYDSQINPGTLCHWHPTWNQVLLEKGELATKRVWITGGDYYEVNGARNVYLEPGADMSFYKSDLCTWSDKCQLFVTRNHWQRWWWKAQAQVPTERPYLRRDRYWKAYEFESGVVAKYIYPGLPESKEVTRIWGTEKTETREFASKLTVEAEFDAFESLKTTIELSYSFSYSQTVTEQKTETVKINFPDKEGKVVVYQYWRLIDRYSITDKDGMPYRDPNIKVEWSGFLHQSTGYEAKPVTEFNLPNAAAPPQDGEGVLLDE